MAAVVGMHAIRREGEFWLRLTPGGEGGIHGAMDINDFPSGGALRQQPGAIRVEHCVVAFVRLRVGLEAGGQKIGFDGERIEDWGGEMDDFGATLDDAVVEFLEAVLEGAGAFGAERVVDAIIHAVAGEDELGSGFFEDATETFMHGGPWELASGVAGFAQARGGFAGEAEWNDRIFFARVLRDHGGLDDLDVAAGLGDAVTEKDEAFFGRRGCGGRGARTDKGRQQGEAQGDNTFEHGRSLMLMAGSTNEFTTVTDYPDGLVD